MSLELSPAMRRISAVGLVFVAVALIWAIVGSPLLDAHIAAETTIEHLAPLLERDRAVQREVPALRAELQQAKTRENSAGGFLEGPGESIAAAQLQARFKAAVEHANGNLRSIQVLPGRDEGAYRRVTVRGEASMNLTALQGVVYDLEASVAYLFVDSIEVRQEGDGRSDKQSDDPMLDVRMDVSGFLRSGS